MSSNDGGSSLRTAGVVKIFKQLCATQSLKQPELNATDKFPLPARAESALALLETNIVVGHPPNQRAMLEKGSMTTAWVRKQARCYNALLQSNLLKTSGKQLSICETGYHNAKQFSFVSLAMSVTVFLSALPPGSRYIVYRAPSRHLPAFIGFDIPGAPLPAANALPKTLKPEQTLWLTADLLNTTMFPGQLDVPFGPSRDRLPAYLAAHPSTQCDALSIEGQHKPENVMRDWAALRPRVRLGGLIFIDDAKPAGKLGFDRTKTSVWSQLLATHEVRPVGCKVRKATEGNQDNVHTFCVGEFVGSATKKPKPQTNLVV